MNKLADVLKRFNRKERNLLVRAVLGDEQKPLLLSDQFRKDVANKLRIEIQPDAWWATDYHINWLAGALAYYAESDACLNRARRNSVSSEPPPSGQMIEQNQEDVDLIIVSDNDLILIEAKAYGYFDNPQLESKLERLNLVRNEYLCITKQNPVVQMHFLLISPTEPRKIKVTWPEWIRKKSEIPWIPLHLPSGEPILKVNRCDADANELAEGDHWRIVKYRARQPTNPQAD